MAVVAPFRGVRYNPKKIEHLEDVVTPPYDIISADVGAKLQEKNPYSMINLDLRNTSQDDTIDDGRYHRARSRFDAWQEDAVLIRDEQPSIYLYYIDYIHPTGKRMTRKGLVALVGLAEFSDGIVKPHEKTFAGVITDRLELMEECQAQFSKIFSLYSDSEQVVIVELEKKRESEPLCRVKDNNGNMHTLWRITDHEALTRVHRFFADKSIYIADGHHRYTTALDCRRRALALNPDLPLNSPYNYIMMYLCASEDDGLSVLPTHRLLQFPGSMSAAQLIDRMAPGLEISEVKTGVRETLIAEVINRMDEAEMAAKMPAFGVYHAGEDRAFLLRVRDERVEQSGSLAEKPKVLRNLDVVVLSELLIHDYLNLSHEQCVKEKLVSYFSDSSQALDVAVKRSVLEDGYTPLLFLLNPTRVDQVTSVADSGEIMPHKSTYFYPKIMTGLLLNKLVGDEKIMLPE